MLSNLLGIVTPQLLTLLGLFCFAFVLIFLELTIFWLETLLDSSRTWSPFLVSETVSSVFKFLIRDLNNSHLQFIKSLSFFQRADAANNDHRQGCKHLTQAVCTVGSQMTYNFCFFMCWCSIPRQRKLQLGW